MGKKFVYFRCHHCGYCCTDVVCCPTPYDVIQIVKATKLHPKKFITFFKEGEIAGIYKSDPTWLKIGKERYMMALKRTRKGCYFRDPVRKVCRIYEHRPLLCRLFPFKLHQKRSGEVSSFSLHKDVGCPKNRDGVVKVDELTKLWELERENQEDYKNLVAYFNSKKEERRPFDFVELFVVVVNNKKKK
ncbi:MAG: YkgJ family cysteine cluster protein [Candidatus Hydrogenedentes bacterium]|nr:YkgJ family cysteine cluster protein [Candidatus Hydrogenedentota bacterium]